MAKARITIEIDYHPGTRALSRLLSLLDWAMGEYGIRYMSVESQDIE